MGMIGDDDERPLLRNLQKVAARDVDVDIERVERTLAEGVAACRALTRVEFLISAECHHPGKEGPCGGQHRTVVGEQRRGKADIHVFDAHAVTHLACLNCSRRRVVKAWRARCSRILTALGVTPSMAATSVVEISSMSRITRIERCRSGSLAMHART